MDSETFFVVKGLVALVGTLLLVAHMWRTRHDEMSLGQVLRYLTLLGFAVLGAAASPEQIGEGVGVEGRNKAALGLFVLLNITALVSIYEQRPKRKVRKNGHREG